LIVHPHIQRFIFIEAKASAAVFKLMQRQPEIEKDAVNGIYF